MGTMTESRFRQALEDAGVTVIRLTIRPPMLGEGSEWLAESATIRLPGPTYGQAEVSGWEWDAGLNSGGPRLIPPGQAVAVTSGHGGRDYGHAGVLHASAGDGVWQVYIPWTWPEE